MILISSLRDPDFNKVIEVVDSHTEGEPTRVIVSGGPELGTGPLLTRRGTFLSEYDYFRSAVVMEPRGSSVFVGALLCPPEDPSCVTGVIFFNNVGYLNMCGHGTMGVIVTLAHLGRIGPGAHRVETPVGVVEAVLHDSGEVSVVNVPSHRKAADVVVDAPGLGKVKGDIAWGGNWFFLVENHGQVLDISNAAALTAYTSRVLRGVHAAGHTTVDHVELTGPPSRAGAHSKNFVLCPGLEYDRSPCGTGTCARLACLAADGILAENQVWVQESIIGSTFSASYRKDGARIIPTITGRAFVNGTATLFCNSRDPYCFGLYGA